MLQITAKHNIFIAIQPVDFRRGIDGLASYCRKILIADPMSGHVFIFRNKKAKAIKVLMYDSQGFWLCIKRLSHGKFNWWPKSRQLAMRLSVPQLHSLLWNTQPSPQALQQWQPINTDE